MLRHWVLSACGLLCWLSVSGSSRADIITFANTSTITIPSFGLANPYPSSINVSGISTSILNIQVSLLGLNHTSTDDLAAVIVAPSGSSTLLFSGPGGFSPAVNLNLIFDDNAAAQLPDEGALVSGTYQPGHEQWEDFFPLPGPGGWVGATPPPWSYNFAPLFSENPNGQWNLFVLDGQAGDSGSISGGWSVTFEVAAIPEPASACVLGGCLCLLALRRQRVLPGAAVV